MEYSYEITLDDMMVYQEQLFLSECVPSIKDSVKRWERLVFLLLLIAMPLVLYLILNNLLISGVGLVIGGIISAAFKSKSTIYFWQNYQSKARKDLLVTYFNNDEKATIPYTLTVSSDKLEIRSTFAKKRISTG
ncbi:hypothetical protein [Candidatus Enterococcus clewellii]|uniref:Uncharacterized protein n=1 Tax=Candidatus Enterococcus clewellii TaxID=1834193 RepID=A0A242K5I4_9ENTE|nr:hypothetical protein [Enterococcus sp. 9E7_DIV0242]OTP13644.1 hypothetical protein A5888_003122 [Enterococcus sp. 9E7_DIV0242]